VALLDPHGDLVASIRDLVPKEREKDVVFVNLPDLSQPWHFNPLANVPPDKVAFAAASMVEVFKKLWPDDWGPRLEYLLRNVVFTLLETPGFTLADIPALPSDKTLRATIVEGLKNEVVRDFWKSEFDRYSRAFRAVVVAPLQNKIGALLTDPILRQFLTQDGTRLQLHQIINQGKILLVNLDKGRLGEGPSATIGSFLVSHMALTGLARSETREEHRRAFFIYLDEFQTFTTLSIANMLSELRKYRVGMVLAHQHLSQLEPEIRDAVFGNAGTMISVRVGGADAAILAREVAPTFKATDLTGLQRYCVYLRLLIDGDVSRPFSAMTLGALCEIPGWQVAHPPTRAQGTPSHPSDRSSRP
jgi:hypothetical protein